MINLNEAEQTNNNNSKRILLPLMFIPCLFINRVLNNDIWFILNSGRYILNNGIPYIEPFTIHQDMSIVMQQWLSSIIFWICYKHFGEMGIFALIALCYSLTVFFMYKLTMLISDNNFYISYFVTFTFSFCIILFMISRPIIFTLLLIVLVLYNIEKYIKTKNKRNIYILPVFSVLLINLQAAMWPMLFIILAPYVVDSIKFKFRSFFNQGYEKRHLIIVVFIMLLVGLINPYGVKALVYLFSSYGYPEISTYVTEMKVPNINDALGMFIYGLMFIIFMIYHLYKKGRITVRYILLTVGTGVMALSSIRNLSFFIVCAIFPLSFFLKDIEINEKNERISKKALITRLILIAFIIFIIAAVFIENRINKKDEYRELNEVIDYIINNEKSENIILYTSYKDGGLAEFRGIPSYIDPRADVFVKKNNKKYDIMREYVDMQSGKLYYKDVLTKYNFTHLIVSNKDILNTYLPYDKDYKIIFYNDDFKLFRIVKYNN